MYLGTFFRWLLPGFLALVNILALSGNSYSQNCIDLGGANPSSYTQNFNGLGASPAPQSGDNANITILNASNPRRYLGKFDNAVSDANGAVNVSGWAIVEEGSSTNSVTGRYNVGDGSANGANTYSFASAAVPNDRALGSLNDDTVVRNFLGGCFRNTSGVTIQAVRIGFTGEMWRYGGAAILDRMDFQYAVNASNLYAGPYVDFDALDFVTPNQTGTAGARDGNAVGFRTVFSPTLMTVTLAPNETLYVRWLDQNLVGVSDDGLAIDDFSIQLFDATSASASLGGRTTTAAGRPIMNISVVLQGNDGSTRFATTSSMGYYNFADVPVGQPYVLSLNAKRFHFVENVKLITLKSDILDMDFSSIE